MDELTKLKEENLHLKISIAKFLCQFYERDFTIKALRDYGLGDDLDRFGYTSENSYEDSDEVKCIYHLCEGAGETAFVVLGIEKDIILDDDLYEIERKMQEELLLLRANYYKDKNSELNVNSD